MKVPTIASRPKPKLPTAVLIGVAVLVITSALMVLTPIYQAKHFWFRPIAFPANHSASSPLPTLTRQEVLQMKDQPSVYLIDARSVPQYQAGHLPNALHIYVNSKEELAFFSHDWNNLPQPTFIVYCGEIHCHRSELVANVFRKAGYQKVYVYPGGWSDWIGLKPR